MTPSPPDEAIHIRGKTLTPESPRPLHVPEPSNIPLLQNQMDPTFDDTAAYEPKPSEDHMQLYQRAPEDGSFPGLVNGGNHHDGGGARGGNDEVDVDHGVGPGPVQGQKTGSFHSEPLQMDGSDRSIHTNHTCLSTAALPSSNASSATTEPAVQPALTVLPSDPPQPPPPPLDQQHQATFHNPSQASHAALDSAPYQLGSFASEVDTATDPNATQTMAPGDNLQVGDGGKDTAPCAAEDGVDFQNLLDNLTPSASAAPSDPAVAATTSSSAGDSTLPQSTADSSLPTPAGLPPRPPPQEKPSIHPNYSPNDDIRSYHQLPSQNPNASATASYTPQQSNNYQTNSPGLPQLVAAAPGVAPGTSSGANGLPPPPGATSQQQQQQPQQPPVTPQDASMQSSHKGTRPERYNGRQSQAGDDEAPWPPEIQKKYDEFLHDERVYVTEGLWDRFPPGSRLFVGNLPTERVTKRDLFHVFHKYGKLAQISIKQAYGFIQFFDANSCYEALQGEQGGVVRGRKIHLEISKPQRNSRQGPPPPEPPRASASRRSRSPEYGRGGTGGSRSTRTQGGDRLDRSYDSGRPPFSDFRDEPGPRRRDDYRPPRSPSPRGFRGREEYRPRDRSPDRYRRRSRSPYGRDRRYRSPSPRGRSGYDSDSDLPFPRRAPRDVPDVQIIVLDDVDRNFIFHVESSFKNRGLRIDVLMLPPRVSLSAVIERQINEGVLAVVKLSRNNQYSGKVPLQVFDRSGGANNVRFNEYSELDLSVAAEMAVHAQSLQRPGVNPPPVFPPNPAFPAPSQFPQAQPQPQTAIPALSNPSQIAQLISSLDGPTLQSLLGALQQAQTASQPTQQPFPAMQTGNPVDLASLLSNATRQPNQMPPVHSQPPSQPIPTQPFGMPVQQQNAPVVPDPNLISLLAKGLGGGKPPQNQAAVAPQVQNIVNQLAKWKQ